MNLMGPILPPADFASKFYVAAVAESDIVTTVNAATSDPAATDAQSDDPATAESDEGISMENEGKNSKQACAPEVKFY